MTTYETTTFHYTHFETQVSDDFHQGYAPWVQECPPAQRGTSAAEDLSQHLTGTRERCDEIFEIWDELRDYYGGADVQEVLTAMNDLVGQAMALQTVGEAVLFAHSTYADQADTLGHHQVKFDNDQWAPGFAQRFATMESDQASMSRDEFEEKYGQRDSDERREMYAEREPYSRMATHVVEEISAARETYEGIIATIDLGALSGLTFELRNEAVDVADTVEELTDWIMESEAFEHLDLDREDARRIAEQAFQAGGWTGDYTDAEGRTWVRAADGRMVRAGSMMDPNLSHDVLLAMVEDDEIGQLEVEVPSQDGSEILTTTISELYDRGSDATEAWLRANRPDLDPSKMTRGFVALDVFVGLIMGAQGASSQRDLESQLYPLLNAEELDDRYDRNLITSGIETGATTTIGVAAAVFAPATFGASLVFGAVVSWASGSFVGWVVGSADEALTTASAEEIDEMSDEDFNR